MNPIHTRTIRVEIHIPHSYHYDVVPLMELVNKAHGFANGHTGHVAEDGSLVHYPVTKAHQEAHFTLARVASFAADATIDLYADGTQAIRDVVPVVT